MSPMLLAGDIGGTKTTLGLFPIDGSSERPEAKATFPSGEYNGLEEIAQEFLKQNRASVRYASFGVAGPVIRGRAKVTNLPWLINEKSLSAKLHIPRVHLINDIEAIATSVPHLRRKDLATLNRGRRDPKGPLAVIAPGTGLGEAFVTREGRSFRVHPSEGGHSDFAPTDRSQEELLTYLQKRFDHVSYELVCSGLGIRNVHRFLEATSPPEPTSLHARELDAEDPVPIIVESALSGGPGCSVCSATLDMFVSVLGAEAGNLALKVLSTGGVYLGGGMPRRVLPLLKDGSFMKSFTKKGRLSEILSDMPVHVILNQWTPLLGAAHSGFEDIRLNPGRS
jgi:glucokinase